MTRLKIFIASVLLSSVLFAHGSETLQECYRYLDAGNYQQAYITALTLLNHQDSKIVSQAYYVMGYARRKQNYFGEAIHYYEKAIGISPDLDEKAKISNNLIAVLMYVSLYEQAIIESNKAAQLSEKWKLVSMFNKAASEHHLKKYEESIATIDEGIQMCKETSNPVFILKFWNLKAEIMMELGKIQDAKELLSNSIKEGKKEPETGNKYKTSRLMEVGKALGISASIAVSEKDTTQAIHLLEDAYTLQPDPQEKYFVVLELIRLINDPKSKWIETALMLYPDQALSERSLRLFFLIQDSDLYDPKFFEKEFTMLMEQENKAKQTYTSYIGRQILKEQEFLYNQKQQKLWNLIGGIGILILTAGLVFYFRYEGFRKFE